MTAATRPLRSGPGYWWHSYRMMTRWELTNLRLRDGATLYRGRADVSLSVIEVESGDVLFSHGEYVPIPEYHPASGGRFQASHDIE